MLGCTISRGFAHGYRFSETPLSVSSASSLLIKWMKLYKAYFLFRRVLF